MANSDDISLLDAQGGGETIPDPPAFPSFRSTVGASWDAALKWLSKGGMGRKCCTLSPMDEMMYFATPRTTAVDVSQDEVVQLCQTNPMRVVVAFWRATLGGNVVIGIDEHLETGPQNIGLSVSGELPPVIFTQAQHGILCQTAWYGRGVSDPDHIVILVTEVLLNKYPTTNP